MSFSLRINGANFTNYFTTFVNAITFPLHTGLTKPAGTYYQTAAATTNPTYANTADLYLDANVNSQYSVGIETGGNSALTWPTISFQKSNTSTVSATAGSFGGYLSWDGTQWLIKCIEGTTINITPNITTAITFGTRKTLRLRRRSGVFFLDASTDSGSTWTPVHQFTTVDNGLFYPAFYNQPNGGTAPVCNWYNPQM